MYVRTVADAFGQMLLDGTGPEIIERDDGFVDAAKMDYFAPAAQWPAVERRALRWVRGRVLDAGLGAGRAARELQRRGRTDLIAPWFDYLIVSPDEMATILEATPWRIRNLIEATGSGYYVAVLE